MSKIVNIVPISPNSFEYQEYSQTDENLIAKTTVDIQFNPSEDILEYFIFNLNNDLLFQDTTFTNYALLNNQIQLNPEADISNQGFTEGQYFTHYNFLRKKLSSSPTERYYIDEISSDRTEIRLNTTQISNTNVVSSSLEFQSQISSSQGVYLDFFLDFGSNKLVIANNIQLDNSNANDPTVLIKLYEPLPTEFDIKSECWVVEEIADSVSYQIELIEILDNPEATIQLRGPNTNLNIKDQINNSTAYQNYNSLLGSPFGLGSSSFTYQVQNILAQKGIEINIDYSDYSNFIHFSSAKTRLENFYYKLSLLEQYNYSASLTTGLVNNIYLTNNDTIWQNRISDIITNFDGYEHFLYFESGSSSWPKSNINPPYVNVPTTASIGQNWLLGQLDSASFYDLFNKDALTLSIPLYLREDSANDQYLLFVEMLGQHYDSVWVYIKDITQKFNADNRLNYGISKDLVAQAIRDLGIKIYQNNWSTNDLYLAFLGITPSGSLYGLPFTTGSLPVPNNSGLEYINTYITASSTSSLEPIDDVNKEIYKRIYHNIPYLLKKKGTIEGLRALITLYGIPDTILRINEFGGQNKILNNDYDYWENKFNYAFTVTGSSYNLASTSLNGARIPWKALSVRSQQSPAISVPGAIEFRFKTFGLPTSNIPYSQSIIHVNNSSFSNEFFNVVLEYTGSGYETASYSGGPIDPYYQYANLRFYLTSTGESASVFLPFFDGDWWSVLINATTSSAEIKYELYVKNKVYNGYDGNKIGFQGYNSFTSSVWWDNKAVEYVYLGGFSHTQSTHYYGPISGAFQEFRYYTFPLSESAFNDYVMNPYSIEGNQLSGSTISILSGSQTSPQTLLFRAPLGSELDNSGSGNQTRKSIHPLVTGSYAVTNSFVGNSSDYLLANSYTFEPNIEYIYLNQVPVGIKNSISNKIQTETEIFAATGSINLPEGNTLSKYRSIQQPTDYFTKDLNYLEVAFSPQDEINNDIVDQLGYFNVGDYIGDPRDFYTTQSYYTLLNKLRDNYFLKYEHNYQIWDYIRLIEFYDNSLFKMIKDWIPARTSLSSGIVIKQNLLERQKYPQPQISYTSSYYTTSIKSIPSQSGGERIYVSSTDQQGFPIETFDGGAGGIMNIYNSSSFFNLTQSWNITTDTISGSVTSLHSSQDEFYNGEFSGSNLAVTTQSLNDCYFPLDIEVNYLPIVYRGDDTIFTTSKPNYVGINQFILSQNSPNPGEIYLHWNRTPEETVLSTTGVEYIKINRLDSASIDHTIQLEQLENIRIKYSSGIIVDYPVISITEYGTYYLYHTNKIDITSSIDNEIKNYKVQVEKTSSQQNSSSPALGGNYLGIGSWDIINFNSQSYFNTSSGIYTQNNLSNIDLLFTASIIISSSLNEAVNQCSCSIALVRYDGTYWFPLSSALTSAVTPLPSGVFTNITLKGIISASYLNENETFQLGYRPFSVFFGAWSQAQVFSSSLTITQSVNPQTGSYDLTIFEPYITEPNFYNSDCNPTINNIDDYPTNNLYMDVSYNNGQLQAQNFQAILSGSAPLADVKPYYYSAASQINPRYVGVRNTDTSSAQTYNDYFAVYAWIGSSYPEIIGGGNVRITKIIDRDGTVISPDSELLNNLDIASIFKSGETASLYFLTGSNSIYNVPIINGACLYQSLMWQSNGAVNTSASYVYNAGPAINTTGFLWLYNSFSQSISISGSLSSGFFKRNWLWPYLSSSAGLNNSTPSIELTSYMDGNINIYNNITSQYETNICPINTLFPIQNGDLIRIGTSATINSNLSQSFNQTFYIDSIFNGDIMVTNPPQNYISGALHINSPLSSSLQLDNQSFVLYRRLDTPYFIVIKDLPSNTGGGLIIPQNYDPSLNYLELARKAGIIT